jgi:hypothetical protein
VNTHSLALVGELLNKENFVLNTFPYTQDEVIKALATNSKKLRLGHQLERYFQFLINNSYYETLTSNLQIIVNKTTIGELDFILRDTITNQLIHVEIATKFYLYDPSFEDELKRWIGPNRKDSLLQKMDKLQEKQFPLLYHNQTIEVLKILGIDVLEIKQALDFRAQLFVPFHLLETKRPYIDTRNIAGYYLPIIDFTVDYYQEQQYFLPKKLDWLIAPKNNEEWYSFSEVLLEIRASLSNKQSPMLWMKTKENTYAKLFIVWW